jgi:protein-disulfide isomerase
VTQQQNLEVVVFGDYLDPFTRAACAAVAEAGARVAFRHFPRKSALPAALAAEAARELGAFAPMHEALLAHDGPLTGAELRALATRAGLDPARFEEVFGSDTQMDRIRADVQAAAAAGVDDTPALFLDGERLPTYEPGWLRERLARARG